MQSTYHLLGVPEAVGVLFVSAAVVLSLAGFSPGHDFGVVKVPRFQKRARIALMVLGPILIATSIGAFLPFWPAKTDMASGEGPKTGNTAAERDKPGHSLVSGPICRTVRRTEEFHAEGYLAAFDKSPRNPYAGSRIQISTKSVWDTELVRITEGRPSKIRRTFLESTTSVHLVSPQGEKFDQANAAVQQGHTVVDEIADEPGSTEPKWHRRLLGDVTVTPALQSWLESLPHAERSEDRGYRSRVNIGETWSPGPRIISWREITSRIPLSLSNGQTVAPSDINASGEMTTTYNFVRVDRLHGETCAVIQESGQSEFSVTHLPTGASFRLNFAMTGTLHRSLARYIDLQGTQTGSMTAEIYNVPMGKSVLTGKISATADSSVQETVLKE